MKNKLIKVLSVGFIALSIFSIFPKEANAEWIQDNKGWWYSNGGSYYTGWKLIDHNWYYFYSDGYMATNKKIGDYFVNSTGAWTNEITADEAYQLILNEDGNFLTKRMTPTEYGYCKLEYCGESDYNSKGWNIPKESMYSFELIGYSRELDGSISDYGDLDCEYFVGKESKNVYVLPNQGAMDAYQIQDNNIIKTYKYLGSGTSYKWR